MERDLRSETSGAVPAPLRLWLWLVVGLTAVNVAVEVVCHWLRWGYPYDWPFVRPESRAGDLLDWVGQFQRMHSTEVFVGPHHLEYPGMVFYGLFAMAGGHALAVYLTLAAVGIGTILVLFALRLRAGRLSWVRVVAVVGATVVTSYPLWFLLHQANLELFVWLLVMTGLWAFCSGRTWLAAGLLGVVAATKFYPAIYLLLLFERRTWREAVLGVSVAVATVAVMLWVMCPRVGYSLAQMRLGTSAFVERNALHVIRGQVGFDHTLFALVKVSLTNPSVELLRKLLSIELMLGVVFVALVWWSKVRRLPVVNRVLFFAVVSIWLTPVSFDYTLVHLYAPWAMLVVGIMAGERLSRRGWVVLMGLAVVMTAQGYVIYLGDHFAAQVKSLALLGMVVAVVGGGLTRARRGSEVCE